VIEHDLKRVQEQLKELEPGDLVQVEWFDASIGKSIASGPEVDIPVESWGIYIGVLGKQRKHIVLAQNSFRYSADLYDIDYTSIPLTWTINISIITQGVVSLEEANLLLKSFLAGRRRTMKRRTENHAFMD